MNAPLRKMSDFTDEEFVQIAALRRAEHSARELAERFHTTDSVIRKIYQMVVFAGPCPRKGDV